MPRFLENKDLFHNSTMTFGEHLEELRVCLFKAILGLALGCVVGLLVGGPVVDFIQTPLRLALKEYYAKQAGKKSSDKVELAKLQAAGYTRDEDVQRVQKIVEEKGMSFDVVYVDPKGLLGQAKANSGAAAAIIQPHPEGNADAEADDTSLTPIVLFRPVASDPRTHVKSLNSQEPFMIYLKASMLVGALIAGPWVFFQIWTFVAAGLYPHEKHYVHLFLPFSIGLFLTGAAMAFFLVFAPVLRFLFSFNSFLGIDPEPRINEWMGFVLMMPLGFGISFQLPLVMLFMERIGIFTVQAYLTSWRIAILAIFVLAMILTPSGDPYSMMLMAAPLTVLYFGGILLCKFLPRHRSRFDEEGSQD